MMPYNWFLLYALCVLALLLWPMRRRRIVDHLVTIAVGPGRHGAKKYDPARLRVTWSS